ncbi:rRNA biogenesis protein rrp36 [Cyphellophora attinorum]|uniref:rRNA biogenesis protein RRP36 n=1 Tax=Cyphellophora attinorum TaxID=1664694 RepID=A0A0N1H0W1_9EURO|nr:rRNA biogenesis protein rrp36 [Phialophora attinorum]KPI37706.1 rRNA biogenesis protein rrp36 [Phialophora attinorum]
MTAQLTSRGPIQLRHDISDAEDDVEWPSEEDSEDEASANGASASPSDDGSEEQHDSANDSDNADDTEDTEPPEEKEVLKDIDFGTLAEAQERFAPQSRKRKLPTGFDADHDADTNTAARPPAAKDRDRYGPPAKVFSTIKHAPAIHSSRQQVSRTRSIFSPPPATTKSRDPRFDPTVMSATLNKSSVSKANRNYSFLTSYQADEVLSLKQQIKKAAASGDVEQQDSLKRQLMSLEAKLRNSERVAREEKVVAEHNAKEKAAIREGKKAKPFYLKPGEIRKQAEEVRKEAMGKKARDKAEKRRQKREKGRDSRGMPRVRRE